MKHLFSLFNSQEQTLLDEFFHYLRFKSISSLEEARPELDSCAAWVKAFLGDAGMEVEEWSFEKPSSIGGNPVIFAEWNKAGKDKPTLLLYNHYDVQPADPFELWETPPFEPSLRDGKVYARGAQDNKGQCFYVMAAVRALLKRDGSLPINVKMLIEGDEEIGSPRIGEIYQRYGDRLKADHLLLVDVGFHDIDQPSVTLGIRGICSMTFDLIGSKSDLHSGSHGGIVYNANHALVEILAKMRDSEGRITIPGFYDKVEPITDEELADIDLSFEEDVYRKQFEAEPSGGEKEYSIAESAWLRPTLEINGLRGGYTGDGMKTVIPSRAHAKLSCRVVPNQDPVRLQHLIKDFIEANCPPGIRAEFDLHAGVGKGIRTSSSAPIVKIASQALEGVHGKKATCILEGATIPVTSTLAEISGADALLIGYALPGDNIHAPNEHFDVSRLRQGMSTIARIIELLGQ